MRMLRSCLAALSLIAVTACAGQQAPPATSVPSTNPSAVAISASIDTAAKVADALGAAPPATLEHTAIDDRFVAAIFVSLDGTRSAVDVLLDSGVVRPGTAYALEIRKWLRVLQQAANGASSAQKLGDPGSYAAALTDAREAAAALRGAIITARGK